MLECLTYAKTNVHKIRQAAAAFSRVLSNDNLMRRFIDLLFMRLRYFRDIELDFNFPHCSNLAIFFGYFAAFWERAREQEKKVYPRTLSLWIHKISITVDIAAICLCVFFLSLLEPFELQSSCVVCILIKLHAERAMRTRWLALLPIRIFSRRPNHNFIFHFSMSAFICSFIPHREWYKHDTKRNEGPGKGIIKACAENTNHWDTCEYGKWNCEYYNTHHPHHINLLWNHNHNVFVFRLWNFDSSFYSLSF